MIYFVGLWWSQWQPNTWRSLIWIGLVGLLIRAMVIPTPAFLEDDYYRYLWDGAIAATGGNPYDHPPADARFSEDGLASGHAPHLLASADAQQVRSRINHPHLTTVYGPAAQVGFALAHLVSPWKVVGLRSVWLVFDVMTLAALLALLHVLRAPTIWAAWYWWNPLLLREIISSAHMDILVLPIVIAAILLAIRQRPMLACLVLAVAAVVKIWPIVLLPLMLRAACRSRRTIVAGIGLFALASALLWSPAFAAVSDESSGLRTYALHWYNNDLVFGMIARTIEWTLAQAHMDPGFGPHIARFVVGGLLAAFIVLQTVKLSASPQDVVRRSAMVVAALFILSPTQFPWYYLWMLPLLAASPRPALLAYTVTLPLYYAHYDHPWVVWIEHMPILIWLAIDAAVVRARSPHRVVSLKAA
jgi:hypothetical protein